MRTPEETCPTAIDNDPVVSTHTEGTAGDDTPSIRRIEPSPDDPLAPVVSDATKQIYGRILDASDGAVTVYDRLIKGQREDSVSMVETTTSDWRQDVECFPRLPTEIHELIIDYVAEQYEFTSWRDLTRCARVCQAWVPRAQMHLFSAVNLDSMLSLEIILFKHTSFQAAVHRKPFLLQYIKLLWIATDKRIPQQATILSSHHMPRLQKCNISRLDLTIAHPSLYRLPSSAPLLHLLCLDYYTTEKANQLCRFLTSFRSLSILTIIQSLPTIHPIRGHFPHLQFNRSKCALRTLALVLEGKPNLSTLLESFIKAPPFVSHLRHLIVAYSSELTPSPSLEVRDITELLEHCSQSLEEVTVIVGHIMMVPCTNLSSCSHFLDSKVLEKDRKQFTEEVGCLDDILSRERFRSFRKFRIRANVEPFELPKLKERKVNVDFNDNEDPIPW